MFITRKLAHAVNNRLQLIVGLVELGKNERAVREVRELSQLIDRHTESAAEESLRLAREAE